MNTNTQPKLVQDRKTGQWYDPQAKFDELCKQNWFIALMVRLKNR